MKEKKAPKIRFFIKSEATNGKSNKWVDSYSNKAIRISKK